MAQFSSRMRLPLKTQYQLSTERKNFIFQGQGMGLWGKKIGLFTISQSLLKLMPIGFVMPSNHLILSHPLLLLSSIISSIKIFSNESALHIRWPKYQSFCYSISLSNGYSGLISFRNEWFELLAVKGTLKSLFQHHNLEATIPGLSFLYGPTFTSICDYWKNIALTS